MLQEINLELQPAGGCIRATVPASNLPAQLLLRDSGYEAVAIRRGYCGNEDGYLMELRLAAGQIPNECDGQGW
jgi:ribosomal protein S18 acetylase RimI-like enzyme